MLQRRHIHGRSFEQRLPPRAGQNDRGHRRLGEPWATPASRPSAIGAASISSVPDQPKSANPATAQPAKATVPHNAAKVENRRGVIMPPLAPPEPSTRTAKRATMWIVESRCGRARTKAAGRDDFLNVLPVRNARPALHLRTRLRRRLASRREGSWRGTTQRACPRSDMVPIGPYAACQRALPTCADGASRPRLCGEYPPPEAVKSGDCAMPIPACAACATRRRRDEPPRKIAGAVWPADLSCARPCRWFARAADS